MNDIVVTVFCLTYNHEKYISRTLEGFVSQKTNFKFEVLVHDDASTDGTAGIVRSYEEKYPDIIRGIYQTENQYSKRIGITTNFITPNVRGKYVAMCEGDDYWMDEYKLQKQFDAMEENPECCMCVHKTMEIYESGEETGKIFPDVQIGTGIVAQRDFLELCRSYSFHTSSYMFRADEWKKYTLEPPAFRSACRVGDETYMLYFGQLAPVYFISETMSAYRRGVASSWTQQQANNKTPEQIARHPIEMVNTFRLFDEYTSFKYHDIMVKRSAPHKMKIAVLTKSAADMFKKENREYLAILSLSKKAMLLSAVIFPRLIIKGYMKRLSKLHRKKGY